MPPRSGRSTTLPRDPPPDTPRPTARAHCPTDRARQPEPVPDTENRPDGPELRASGRPVDAEQDGPAVKGQAKGDQKATTMKRRRDCKDNTSAATGLQPTLVTGCRASQGCIGREVTSGGG